MEQIVTYVLTLQKFKAKDSEILVGLICFKNISKDWSVDNMKKTGFTGYVYDFSVDYDPIAVDDIKYIDKYLTKKNNNSMIGKYVRTIPLSCISMNNQGCK